MQNVIYVDTSLHSLLQLHLSHSHCMLLSTNLGGRHYWTQLKKCKEQFVMQFIARDKKKFRGVLCTPGIMSVQGSTCGAKISSLCPFLAELGLPPMPLPYSPLSRDFGPHLSQGPPSPKRLSGFDEWTEGFCPYSTIHHFLQMYRIKDRQLSLGSLCSSDAQPKIRENSGRVTAKA